MRGFATILIAAALPLVQLPLKSQMLGLSGRRAPSFSLPDSTMKQHDILDYRGRWVLLDFMRTDCPHCKALSQMLEGAKTHLNGKAAVLSVVLAPPENQQTVAKYVSDNKLTSPIVFDMGQVAVTYFKATPANPSFDTPHLFAIDPSGTIVRDWDFSKLESGAFLKELDQLMAAKK